MATLNVNRSVMDQFYRYKMPRLVAKVEGKGNGIKTVIVNMVDIAKSLSRPPTYPTKFFGCELGAQTQMDLKNERFIVNGSHDANRLQDMLDGFIKKFVLCPECDNPETVLHVQQKKQTISQRCMACGHQGLIDMRHKLTAYILKNPPEMDPFTQVNQSVTPGKKKGKGKRQQNDNNGEEEEGGSPQPSDDGPPGNQSLNGDSKEDDDDDWGAEVSESAVKARMDQLTGGARCMTLTDDIEKTQTERLDMFYEFAKQKKCNGKLTMQQAKDMLAEADRLVVHDKAALLLCDLLLNANMLQQIKQYRPLFMLFCHEHPKAQKYLLGGFEQVVWKYKDQLLSKVPHLLKAFYDMDIVDEDVLQEWGKKVSKKYVSKEAAQEIHDKAAPFIKWLSEAEEDSSEDDSEDELQVDFTSSEAPGTKPLSKAANRDSAPARVMTGGGGGEIDIDAI